MGYKELGAGGERLNAGELNELINNYKMKAHASFSNKTRNLPSLINFESNVVHFLFENIERKSFYDSGEEMRIFDTWDIGAPVPDDIQDVELIYAEDGLGVSRTIRHRSDNLKNPLKIKTERKQGFYLEYWYTYTNLVIDIDIMDPNGYYYVAGVLNSTGGYLSGFTTRVSYGNINVIQSPNAVQNKNLDRNFTNVLGYAFAYNTNIVFSIASKTWKISIDDFLRGADISYFKLNLINDNASSSGMSITGFGSAVTGLVELDHNIISLSSGRYVHELIYSYQPSVNEFGYSNDVPYVYWPAFIESDPANVYYGAVIVLPNSRGEFGYSRPMKLGNILDDTPLTNILLSYMSEILEHPIYKYGPQNYMSFYSSPTVYFRNSSDTPTSKSYNDGDVNTWLTAAGAYYQLLDMLNFNDGQEISWGIQYIK